MRFLANENFPLAGIFHLRAAGQDVVAVIQETLLYKYTVVERKRIRQRPLP